MPWKNTSCKECVLFPLIYIYRPGQREPDLPWERPLPAERFEGDFLEGVPPPLRDLPGELLRGEPLLDEETLDVVV